MTNHYPNEQDAQMNSERRDTETIYCQSCKKWTTEAWDLTCDRCIARADFATQLTGGEYVRAREFFADAGLSLQEIDNLLYSPDFLFGVEVSRKIFMERKNEG